MVLFRDLWKKYGSWETPVNSALDLDTAEINQPPEKPSIPLHPYTHVTQELEQMDTVLANLRSLKLLMEQPKEPAPELRFFQIKQHLGLAETYETLRQERWHPKIHCPHCGSTQLKRLLQELPEPPENHRYLCLDCGEEFNDDSGTPLAQGLPPLFTWIECWYLYGCTDSLLYIAHKLGLELSTVEMMILEMKRLFNSDKPLNRFELSAKLSEQSVNLREQLKQDLQIKLERLGAQISQVPKDTLEFHRQETIRRHGRLEPDLLITPPKPGQSKK